MLRLASEEIIATYFEQIGNPPNLGRGTVTANPTLVPIHSSPAAGEALIAVTTMLRLTAAVATLPSLALRWPMTMSTHGVRSMFSMWVSVSVWYSETKLQPLNATHSPTPAVAVCVILASADIMADVSQLPAAVDV